MKEDRDIEKVLELEKLEEETLSQVKCSEQLFGAG
jgi:hypothetical protein